MSRTNYRFAGVELDASSRGLSVGDRHVEVTPLVFETLLFLARNSDRVVSKDELAAALWEGRVVTDSAITQAIRKARAALEECSVDPALIATRHGHGYRLNTRVEAVRVSDSARQSHAAAHGILSHLKERRPVLALSVAVLGGLLIWLANISDILDFLSPDESLEVLESTHSTVVTTDEKVDEIVAMLRNQAASGGNGLDPDSEHTIRAAVRKILESSDARKQSAVNQLLEGDASAAAARIEDVATELAAASERSLNEAAASWSEAGAIYYTTDADEAVRCYEEALALRPANATYAMDLGYAYIRAGRLDDAVNVFGNALNQQPQDAVLMDVLRGLGISARLKAEYDIARSHFDQALEIARRDGDLRREGLLFLQFGSIADSQGDLETARVQYEAAVNRAEEIADEQLLSRALNSFGIVMAKSGDREAADQAFARAHDIDRARNDLAGQAQSIGNLGASALQAGDVEAAAGYLERSIEIGRQLGDQRSVALDLTNLGLIAAAQDDFEQANAKLNEALAITKELGLEELRLIIIVNLGEAARDSGDTATACRLWLEALPQLVDIEHGAAPVVRSYVEQSGCQDPAGQE